MGQRTVIMSLDVAHSLSDIFDLDKHLLDQNKGEPIEVYNYGKMRRDFTYIDDIVHGVLTSLDRPVPYAIYNLGNSRAVDLLYFIECIEKVLGKKAEKKLLPIQPGDVAETYADINESQRDLGFEPTTGIEQGIELFVRWYRSFYGV